MSNLGLKFRPVCGGISIFADGVDEEGTLGMILTDDTGAPVLLTNHHVLYKAGAAPIAGAVFQPDRGSLIATSDPQWCDKDLDCAVARLSVSACYEIFGMGIPASPKDPVLGMRVVKVGAATGVTEGQVMGIHGTKVTIGVPQAHPPACELSRSGDSGSVWLESATRAPVALHYGGSDTGQRVAFASSIRAILAALHCTVP